MDDFIDSWKFPATVLALTAVTFIFIFYMSLTHIRGRQAVCAEYGTTYYSPANACLTTYGALIVPKEFQ